MPEKSLDMSDSGIILEWLDGIIKKTDWRVRAFI